MKRRGRPLGSKHSPEALAKISQANEARWRDPVYRARHLPRLKAMQPKASKLGNAAKACMPPAGTPAWRQYRKVAAILGVGAARSLKLSAETDRAGA